MGNQAVQKTPLEELSVEFSKYNTKSLTYPSDLQELSHLIMFNINVQQVSKDFESRRYTEANDVTRQTAIRKVGGGPDFQADIKGGFAVGAGRITKRVTTAIALYMPNNLVFDDAQSYKDTSLLDEFGAIGVGVGNLTGSATAGLLAGKAAQILGAIAGAFRGGLEGAAAGAKIGGNIDKSATSFAKSNLTKLAGYSVNPMIEVIYEQPALRKFQFDFNFAPKNKSEAQAVRNIIKEFRRHAAPEFKSAGPISGAFFTPPSEFDISFHGRTNSGFSENLNMPRISTCVLETVNTNYTPEMFQTFVDGMSVNITLRLAFKELDIITRERIDVGF